MSAKAPEADNEIEASTDEFWNETMRYPQTDLTETCEEHPDADLLRYKTGPNSTWVQCTECGSLLGGE